MNNSSPFGTVAGYKPVTMYVISEKGLESGPFLYGKATDSRVFGDYRSGNVNPRLKLTSKVVHSTAAKGLPVEFGPRGTGGLCVVNLNTVLSKYKKKLPGCDELKEVKRTTPEDYRYRDYDTTTMRAKDLRKQVQPDCEISVLSDGRIANETRQRSILSIQGCQSLRKEHCMMQKDKFRLEKLEASANHQSNEEVGSFWNQHKRDFFTVAAHERKSNPEDTRGVDGNLQRETERHAGELLLLKKISSCRDKIRSERGKTICCNATAGRRDLGKERKVNHGSRKQLIITTEARSERPLESLENEANNVSGLKLPDVVTGLACKAPIAFQLKDYDQWSRRHKKISSSNLFSTEGAKSGKSLLPAIVKKC